MIACLAGRLDKAEHQKASRRMSLPPAARILVYRPVALANKSAEDQ